MKHPVFFGFFYISAPVMILLRVIQQIFLIDQQTGFIKAQFETIGNAITYATYIYIALIFIWVMFLKHDNKILVQHSMTLCVITVFCALILLVGAIIETFDVGVMQGFLGILASITMVLYAFSVGVYGRFAKGMSVTLSIYATLALCNQYLKYRKVATFNNAKFEILTGASILLFTICFTRIINNYQVKSYKKMFYFSALTCFLLCSAQSLFPIVATFSGVQLHGGNAVNLRYVAFALFCFTTGTLIDVKTKYQSFSEAE